MIRMITARIYYASFADEVYKKRGIESLMYPMQSLTHLKKKVHIRHTALFRVVIILFYL